jgi:hypothetical protein
VSLEITSFTKTEFNSNKIEKIDKDNKGEGNKRENKNIRYRINKITDTNF